MYNHILIPVAPGHIAETGQALSVARKLLEPGGKISVLTVLEEVPSHIGEYVPPDYLVTSLAQVTVDLETEFKTEGIETHATTGHAANSILDWANGHGVDCIAIASHRPGFVDYLIGSTAARVARHAKCSVHVLR